MPSELWCMRVPGSDDIYAAESREAAEKMVEQFNAFMRRPFYRGWSENDPSFESCLGQVEPWPYSAEAHAQALRDDLWWHALTDKAKCSIPPSGAR